VHADLVILLSAMEGLIDPETGGAVPYVEQIDRGIRAMITEEKTDRGAGGMHSKIEAVRQLVMSGEPVILADGTRKNVLIDLFREKELGTLFKPAKNKLKRKKRWIAFSASPSGDIQIDPGAVRALCRNSSLLAIGITAVSGNFRRGAMVRVMHRGREIARGLVNYDSQTIEKIRGLKSSQFTRMLGGSIYEEVIHKDNLVVTAGA
jgi:glutamate 5-kinase